MHVIHLYRVRNIRKTSTNRQGAFSETYMASISVIMDVVSETSREGEGCGAGGGEWISMPL